VPPMQRCIVRVAWQRGPTFACLDKYGRLRHFSLNNAHVTPSCPDVLIGTNMNSGGFDFAPARRAGVPLASSRGIQAPQCRWP
jgi:hypothetical protein